MNNLWDRRQMAVAGSAVAFSVTLAACGANRAEKAFHPDLVRLRSMVEHGTTIDTFQKTVNDVRGTFEVNKDSFSSKTIIACEAAISGAENLRDMWNALARSSDIQEVYAPLLSMGVT